MWWCATRRRKDRTRTSPRTCSTTATAATYDTAVIVSNDSDFRHPIELVRRDLGLRVGIVNPHRRLNRDLREVADFRRQIREGALRASQFPDRLTDEQGAFHRPAAW